MPVRGQLFSFQALKCFLKKRAYFVIIFVFPIIFFLFYPEKEDIGCVSVVTYVDFCSISVRSPNRFRLDSLLGMKSKLSNCRETCFSTNSAGGTVLKL